MVSWQYLPNFQVERPFVVAIIELWEDVEAFGVACGKANNTLGLPEGRAARQKMAARMNRPYLARMERGFFMFSPINISTAVVVDFSCR
jgi:hypothetical protein